MEKNELKGYLEFLSHLTDYSLNAEFQELLVAADESQIHTFGWPIGPVLHTDEHRPQPYSQDAIRAVIDMPPYFDYWTLKKNGEYYILKSLFEDSRGKGNIFIDTRTIRTSELLLRTARLYEKLGVPISKHMSCRIEHGGLLNRRLTAANSLRAVTLVFPERKCSIDQIVTSFQEPISNFLNMDRLKEMVYETVKAITEMCDMFVPSKSAVTDVIIDEYYKGKIT